MTPAIEAMLLREHARVLRKLASVEHHPRIKDDLNKVAEKCEELASTALRRPRFLSDGAAVPHQALKRIGNAQ
jgi:hypothetical protein